MCLESDKLSTDKQREIDALIESVFATHRRRLREDDLNIFEVTLHFSRRRTIEPSARAELTAQIARIEECSPASAAQRMHKRTSRAFKECGSILLRRVERNKCATSAAIVAAYQLHALFCERETRSHRELFANIANAGERTRAA